MPQADPTEPADPAVPVFLHGLESSSRGTKGRWLASRYPGLRSRDYEGDLTDRLDQLTSHVAGLDRLVLVGSSFGGLMATCFALAEPARCRRLVLLAPALNFAGYEPPAAPVDVEAVVVLGVHDTVCPPEVVLPLVRATFAAPDVTVADDDHLLHRSFSTLDWDQLLGPGAGTSHSRDPADL